MAIIQVQSKVKGIATRHHKQKQTNKKGITVVKIHREFSIARAKVINGDAEKDKK